MSVPEFQMIAIGWAILLVFLTIFWFATLRRLSGILNERLASARSQPISGFFGLFLYLFRGDFRKIRDERLTVLCRRLRQLLYGYLGGIGAYIVFIVIMQPVR